MGKKGKVTISQIAELLDVSSITVSRALANQPGVSDELRQTIIAKAKELGYKRCKSCQKASILLLIRHRYTADHSNFSQLVEGVQAEVHQKGSDLTIEFVEAEKQHQLILPNSLTKGQRFDGVILLGKFEDQYAHKVQQIVPSLVIINGGNDTLRCNYIYFNYSRIGYLAAEHLIKKGHTRIGYIGLDQSHSCEWKYYGMLSALAKHGMTVDDRFVLNSKDDLTGRLESLVTAGELPTAFICQSDRIALKLIKMLHEYQIAVPDQVSVIGSGNSEMSTISIPELTTFETNIPTVCQLAVATLFDQINGKVQVCRTIYVDAELVERDSVRDLSAKEAYAECTLDD